MTHLLHPELIAMLPLSAGRTYHQLEHRAEILAQTKVPPRDLSIVIRSLNESAHVEALLQDVQRQQFAGEVEVIVVDNESDDGTPDMAMGYGAEVVTISRNQYTHSYALNIGMKAASHDVVFMMVGHALMSTDVSAQAGVLYFEDQSVGGVFSYPPLPSAKATRTERLLLEPVSLMNRSADPVRSVKTGTMAATGAMLRKSAWEECGNFDESMKKGVEDTALAKKMLAAGFLIMREPLLRVHHTHGDGFIKRVIKTAKNLKIISEIE